MNGEGPNTTHWPPPLGLRIFVASGSLDIGHVFKLGFQGPQPLCSSLTHYVLQTHCWDCSGLEAVVLYWLSSLPGAPTYVLIPLFSWQTPTYL